MIIPTPLCAIGVMCHYTDYSLWGAFIRYDGAVTVQSAFHEQGLRIGDQTGLVAAHIEEYSVPSTMSFSKTVSGRNYYINMATDDAVIDPIRPGSSEAGWDITCGWTDGEYQYTATGTVAYRVITRSVGESLVYDISSAYLRLDGIYRAREADISAVDISGKYDLQSFTGLRIEYAKFGTPKQDSVWPPTATDLTSLKQAGTCSEALAHFRQFAQFKATYSVWVARLATWTLLLPEEQSMPDYPSIFATLLKTEEFDDHNLANGLCSSHAHYESRQQPDGEIRDVWISNRGPYGTYIFEWLVQHAWVDAVSAIPQANQNSIQNLQAAFELLAAIRSGNLVELPQVLQDEWAIWKKNAVEIAHAASNKWLQYRYELSTTRQDINEYVEFGLNIVDKYMQQITSSRAHGHARYKGYECNCSLTWSEKGCTGLQRFFHDLYKSGFEPNAYVAWDYIPFSFIADWFIPVGDVLETYTSKQYRNSQYYNFSDVVFSIGYRTGPVAGITASHYVRWVATSCPVVDESYWFDEGDASIGVATTFKRILDSGSLLTGMCLK